MECVSTVSYSILINSVPHKCYKPSKGIQQDDLLFPYLFIICSEVLYSLLLHANIIGFVSSFPTGKGSLKVSHLFFSDDSLILCKANSINWNRMLSLIGKYEQAFGHIYLTKKNPQFSLAPTCLKRLRTQSQGLLVLGLMTALRDIWVYLPTKVIIKQKISISYWIKPNSECQIVKQSFFQLLIEKFSLKQCYKPYPLT